MHDAALHFFLFVQRNSSEHRSYAGVLGQGKSSSHGYRTKGSLSHYTFSLQLNTPMPMPCLYVLGHARTGTARGRPKRVLPVCRLPTHAPSLHTCVWTQETRDAHVVINAGHHTYSYDLILHGGDANRYLHNVLHNRKQCKGEWYTSTCLLDSLRALGFAVPYTASGRYYAVKDGSAMLYQFGLLL